MIQTVSLPQELTEFSNFPENSQVWVYQSNRKLSKQETAQIDSSVKQYTQNWMVHGMPARAMGKVLFDYFLVFVVDANTPASGCSIDASVGFVKQLEQQFQLNFFDRMQIVFEQNGAWEIQDFQSLKHRIKSGEVGKENRFFNNTVSSLSQLQQDWLIPITGSWLDK